MLPREVLRGYFRTAVRTLGTEVVLQPPVTRRPKSEGLRGLRRLMWRRDRYLASRLRYASEVVRLCAKQYDIPFPDLRVQYVTSNAFAGQIRREQGRWYVSLAKHFIDDDLRILSIIAHEMAHVVLLSKGVSLPDAVENERLTDTAAVVAGFGPMMHRAAELQRVRFELFAQLISTTRIGYLSKRDIRVLSRIRSRVAAGRPIRRWSPLDVRPGGPATRCWACGVGLQAPLIARAMTLRCPLCGMGQVIRWSSEVERTVVARSIARAQMLWDRVRNLD